MGHTSFQLDRRQFLKAGIGAAGALAFSPSFLAKALAAPITVGAGPYGPLQQFDSNGIALPDGFTSREIARGASLVQGSTPPYTWHHATDGQATFPTLTAGQPDGGWILVCNSEVPLPGLGGVSGVEFDQDGDVERAYRVLAGTAFNCAGGPAPWGRWLSCEEHPLGMVHECDPTITNAGVARPALGVFAHEAVCVDPVNEQLYLTEDEGDGCLYRFTPASYPSLSAGLLEVAVQGSGGDGAPGPVTWATVPNPAGGPADPTREQVAAAAHFEGGEGTWFDDGIVYFTTKGDNRVWTYDVATSQLDILYDASVVGPDAPLSGVDNITVAPSGDIYVCEDGRDHDICLITPAFEITRFLKLDPTIHSGPPEGTPFADNETVGVVFSPDGTRMYFGAQRSFGTAGVNDLPIGVVYEINGPFRQTAGGGGGGAPASDLLSPGMRLRARKRRRIERFLEFGFPIRLELDELVGIVATLRAHEDGPGDKRSRVIGRATTAVAVRDQVALRLEPTKGATKLLEGREEVSAGLKVIATDAAGNRTVLRRRVRLLGNA